VVLATFGVAYKVIHSLNALTFIGPVAVTLLDVLETFCNGLLLPGS
jgi:hypothetical protein